MLVRLDETLRKWGEENGHDVMTAMILLKNTSGIGIYNDGSFDIIAFAATLESIPKKVEKTFAKLVEPYGTALVIEDAGIFQVTLKWIDDEDRKRQLSAASEAMPSIISELNLELVNTCVYCDEGGTDTYHSVGAAPLPVHISCEKTALIEEEEEIAELLADVENNDSSGKRGISALAAFAGAIVGAIPAFIALYFFNYFVWALFALIPLGAAFVYKKSGGIQSIFMPIIVTVVSLITSILLVFVDMYMHLHNLVWTAFGMPGRMPLDFFFEVFFSALGSYPEILLDFGLAIVACIIGIFISWKYMSGTNENKLEDLEARKEALEFAREDIAKQKWR